MISADSIERVRRQANLAQIVGERVKLERRGRSLIGLCPFHKEKSPSFHVNEERGFYHCFGCRASGDALKFLQETEGLSFIEAVRHVAQKTGIELVETRSDAERRQEDEGRRRRDELFAANQEAANYFMECLEQHPFAGFARAELQRRGLADSTDSAVLHALQAFRIGYAPYGWDGLVAHLRRHNLSLLAAEKLGLIAPRKTGNGHYDRFRHRLMFAIIDLQGKIVGFSGRDLPLPSDEELRVQGLPPATRTEEGSAKYMNSPESLIYKKRETVFGLFQARASVRESNNCVVVEGNFDVVSLHARGIGNVVAPLGTAFTQEQAAQIKRFTQNVTLLFDGDSAGRRASASAREPCRAENLMVRVASLPQGMDPDELIKTKGPDAIRSSVKSARGMLEYLIEASLDSGFASSDVQSQNAKIAQVVALITEEADPTLRALAQTHADSVAARLNIRDARSLTALHRAVTLATKGPTSSRPLVAPPESARSEGRPQAIEEETFAALVEYPSLLADPDVQQVIDFAQGTLALGIAALTQYGNDLVAHLDDLHESLRRVVAERSAAPQLKDENTAKEVVKQNLRKLVWADTRRVKEHTIELLEQARRTGDTDRELQLLGELSALTQQRSSQRG